ncbi:hypothetical protein [Anaeromicropila populeti]|uniref:Uncharacterized protein n=1 Tax=Anaeromicropila populeti TaxID=37658 RepID=A0A1I6JMD2_9FIRM|nr:hypothetical protein [Anaeromicropila populeti]SFR80138.1 hypothetical protein SAMN05661086_01763 [Anaeromicropila populeti]
MEKNKNENSMNHIFDILKAALPYVDNRTKQSMEVAIKTSELAESFATIGKSPELEACDIGQSQFNLEGMLTSIQTVCTTSEKELINTVLNFIKARNLYQSYEVFKQNNPTPELKAASTNNGMHASVAPIIEFLLTQLSPEQKATFDNMNMLFRAMNM